MKQHKGYQHIVAGTDFSEPSVHAVSAAARFATKLGARLTLVHVFEPGPYIPGIFPGTADELDRQIELSANEELERWASQLPAAASAERLAIRNRSAAAAISDCARDREADLCVVGTHGRTGLERLLIGSVAEKVVRHAPCDVMTVSPKAPDTLPLVERIVVGTDFSDPSMEAIDVAGWLGAMAGAELHLVHSFDDTIPAPGAHGGFEEVHETRRRLWEALSSLRVERLAGNEGVFTEVLTARNAADAVCAYAEQQGAGLVVVGTHGRSGISRLLVGSVAERVVRHAPCSTLCVRAEAS